MIEEISEQKEWVENPRTRYLRKKIAKQKVILWKKLLLAAKRSQDVDVRAVAVEIELCGRTLNLLARGEDWTGGLVESLPDEEPAL